MGRRESARPVVESVPRVVELAGEGRSIIRASFPCRLSVDGDAGRVEFRSGGQQVSQSFGLGGWINAMGGRLPFLVCGRCVRLRVRLYLVENVLACRCCHRLTYTSTQEAHAYDRAWSKLRQHGGDLSKLTDYHMGTILKQYRRRGLIGRT